MADSFSLLNNSAGQATTSPTAAALVPTSPNSAILRIWTDSYIRIAFGTSSVSAGTTNIGFAPGVEYVRPPTNAVYYSVVSTTGTANFSITVGGVTNGSMP